MVLRDSRGTRRAEIPEVSEKGFPGGDDPLALQSHRRKTGPATTRAEI